METTLILEILTVILSLLFLYFEVRQSMIIWPLGIVTSLLVAYVMWKDNLIGVALLQFFFIASSIVGWVLWKRENAKEGSNTHYARKGQMVVYLLLSALVVGLSYSSLHLVSSRFPLMESIVMALNIIGYVLLINKHVQVWAYYLVANVLQLYIYVVTDRPWYVGLYVVYIIYSVLGWKMWLQIMKEQKNG